MATYTVEIPGYTPTTLNQLLAAGHWSGVASRKRRDFRALAWPLLVAKVPVARGRRRLTVKLWVPRPQWAPDPDAIWKGLCDALVRHGALVDDSSDSVELMPVECRVGPRSTTLILEDIE